MPLPNNSINLTGVARILFRWKTTGLYTFYACLGMVVLITLFRAPRYESQVVMERKPPNVTPIVSKDNDERFDVYRLTSESQWSVSLLKSRFIMERWLEAIGLHADSPSEKEALLKQLSGSLAIQPISYTDLFVVKVRALSSQEAQRRATLLVEVFAQWDLEQNRQHARELLELIRARIKQVNKDLGDQWAQLKNQKASQSLSLSGSSTARQLELDIAAKGKLYDMLTSELEGAERQMNNDQLPRSRPLAPPSLPGLPVMSRFQMLLLGLCLSLLAGLATVFLREWQDPSIRRSQDILREVPQGSVLAVPSLSATQWAQEGQRYLAPLSDAVTKLVQDRGSAVVQFASPYAGDGKTTFSASLAQMLAVKLKVCLLRRLGHKPSEPTKVKSTGDYTVVDVDIAEPLAPHLAELKRSYNLILIDTDSVVDSTPGSQLAPEAEMACIPVYAGRTTRQFFRAFRSQLHHLPEQQRLMFILNRYEDPLPPWFQQLGSQSLPSFLRRFF